MPRHLTELVEAVKPFLNGLRDLLRENLVEISIFGSTVRGGANACSDVDVLVIFRGGREDVLKVIESVYSSLGDHWIRLASKGYVVELTVMSEDEWKAMLNKSFSFQMSVEEEKFTVFRGD